MLPVSYLDDRDERPERAEGEICKIERPGLCVFDRAAKRTPKGFDIRVSALCIYAPVRHTLPKIPCDSLLCGRGFGRCSRCRGCGRGCGGSRGGGSRSSASLLGRC